MQAPEASKQSDSSDLSRIDESALTFAQIRVSGPVCVEPYPLTRGLTGHSKEKHTNKLAQLAKEFFDAIERHDMDMVSALYASDVKIWHNFDDTTQTKEENLESLRRSMSSLADRGFSNRRTETFKDGFIEQHELCGTKRDGTKVRLLICVVCRVRDGKIIQLDEYVDSAQVLLLRDSAT